MCVYTQMVCSILKELRGRMAVTRIASVLILFEISLSVQRGKVHYFYTFFIVETTHT